jgi:hypothetical protein
MATEGMNAAIAGTQRATELAKAAGETARRTTRTAAKGTADIARLVEQAAEAVIGKLK